VSSVEQATALPETAEYAVSCGVAVLDELSPGWADSVDVDTLDVSNGDVCILGQLFGDYLTGCDMLHLRGDAPARCGFNVVVDKEETDATAEAWRSLQSEWTRVIQVRQEGS